MGERSLTNGEIALAESVYGNSIDYSKVKIHDDKWAFWQPNDTVMTPDGEIYYPDDLYESDFSNGSNSDKALFIHEMGHVLQHQNDIPVKSRRLNEGPRYDYSDIFDGTPFHELPIEAQAEFLEDLWRKRNGLPINPDKTGGGSVDPNIPLSEYENVLPLDLPDGESSNPVVDPSPLPEGEIPPYDPNSLPQDVIDLFEDWGDTESSASPLVLDIDGNGIDLVSVTDENAVYWDIDEDGFKEASGWISGNDGLLAIDLNSDGIINEHSELFGSQSTDGFSELSVYDTNSDNVIDSSDTQFSDLLVWVDANSNGYSESTELSSLSDLNITSINLNASSVDYHIAGNHITHESTFTINGQTETIVDAWFTYSNTDSYYTDDFTIADQTLFLPNLRGFGNVKHLHIAMSDDSSLLNMVDVVTSSTTSDFFDSTFDMQGKIQDIMYLWAGVDGVNPTSRGSNIDARKLEFLENYLGDDYLQAGIDPNPGAGPAVELEELFNRVFTDVLTGIVIQSEDTEFFDSDLVYNVIKGETEGATSIDNIWFLEANPDFQSTDGNDVYVFQSGMGQTVSFLEDINGGTDQVWINATMAEVGMWVDATESLHIQLLGTTDKLEVEGSGFSGTDVVSRLEEIIFSDGTTIDLTQGLVMADTDDSHSSYGSALSDEIDGRGGNDILYGYAGNDTLTGGTGNDNLYGGIGDDTYVFATGFGTDTLTENVSEGTDTISFTDGITLADVGMWVDAGEDLHIQILGTSDKVEVMGSGFSGTDIVSRIEQIIFSDSTTLDFSQGLIMADTDDAHSSYGSALSDVIDGRGGNDTLYGYAGNDTLTGGTGNDNLYGGVGDDTYVFATGFGSDTLTENVDDGTDTISFINGITLADVGMWVDAGEDLHIQLLGTSDKVEIMGSGFSGTDIVSRIEQITFSDNTSLDFSLGLVMADTDDAHYSYGSVLDDVIDGRGGSDRLYGYAGDDTLIGGSGSDYLYGGDDDDVLYGGTGVDMLYGQGGADIFAFDNLSSSDNIQDFDLSTGDKLDISDLLIGYDPLTDAITDFVQITESGSNSYLKVDADGGADNFVQVAYIYNETGLTDEAALETSGNLITV